MPLVPIGQRRGWASHCAFSIGAPSAPWTEERDSGQGGGTGEGLEKDGVLVNLLPSPTRPPLWGLSAYSMGAGWRGV